MKKVKYDGIFEAVTIEGVDFKKGQAEKVSDEIADSLVNKNAGFFCLGEATSEEVKKGRK